MRLEDFGSRKDVTTQTEEERILTVSEVNAIVKADLRQDPRLQDVKVTGEVSRPRLVEASGHFYFTLKDENSQIDCAIFQRNQGGMDLKKIEEGKKVVVRGTVDVYMPRGAYTLIVREIKVTGIGDLYLEYERLKKKLYEEGLFAPEHKKEIPRFPRVIGVVTSPTGAAFRDIINVLSRRFPGVRLILSPAVVQGEEAPDSIVRGIEALDRLGIADVIIVGRGGGSVEDLWCFNDERVARAIYTCKTPIISAVGHEIDFTISDFVADLRAPTPSAAAELAVPDRNEIIRNIEQMVMRMESTVYGIIEDFTDTLMGLDERLEANSPEMVIFQNYQRVDELGERMENAIRNKLARCDTEYEAWSSRLESVSVENVLARGFSILLGGDGDIVSSVESLHSGETVRAVLRDGVVAAGVTGVKKGVNLLAVLSENEKISRDEV